MYTLRISVIIWINKVLIWLHDFIYIKNWGDAMHGFGKNVNWILFDYDVVLYKIILLLSLRIA